MQSLLLVLLFCVVLGSEEKPNSKLIVSDCGDSSYLLHYTHVEASEFKRGKEGSVQSEKELLKANVTSGIVHLQCSRNAVVVEC